jgi:hypothetical protein
MCVPAMRPNGRRSGRQFREPFFYFVTFGLLRSLIKREVLRYSTSTRMDVEALTLAKVRNTHWPHRANFERLLSSDLEWRLLTAHRAV